MYIVGGISPKEMKKRIKKELDKAGNAADLVYEQTDNHDVAHLATAVKELCLNLLAIMNEVQEQHE